MQQIAVMGELVVTIPPELRHEYRTQASLSSLGIALRRMLKRRGIKRGITRWHWFGECKEHPNQDCECERSYHPHFNAIIDYGYMAAGLLDGLRSSVGRIMGVEKHRVNLWYRYADTPGEKFHIVRYVLRNTFRRYQWDEAMAHELKGFRNSSWFGKWNDEKVWETESSNVPSKDVEALEHGVCPDCGEPMKWIGLTASGKNQPDVEPLGDGYYRVKPP